MKKALILIFAIILLSSLNCATSDRELQEPKGVLLTQSELEQLFIKECTYDYRTSKGGWGTMTCLPNGMQEIKWKVRGDSGKDTGTYKITNGQKCNTFDNLEDSNNCWKFYKIGENEYSTVCTTCSDSSIVTFK